MSVGGDHDAGSGLLQAAPRAGLGRAGVRSRRSSTIAPETLKRLRSKCKCCKLPPAKSAALDLAIATQGATKKVASAFGVSVQSALRHRRDHLVPMLAKKLERSESKIAGSVQARLEELGEYLRALRKERNGDTPLRDRVMVAKEEHSVVLSVGRITGELRDSPGQPNDNRRVTVNYFEALSVVEIREFIDGLRQVALPTALTTDPRGIES